MNRLSKYSTYDIENATTENAVTQAGFADDADEVKDLAFTARQPQH